MAFHFLSLNWTTWPVLAITYRSKDDTLRATWCMKKESTLQPITENPKSSHDSEAIDQFYVASWNDNESTCQLVAWERLRVPARFPNILPHWLHNCLPYQWWSMFLHRRNSLVFNSYELHWISASHNTWNLHSTLFRNDLCMGLGLA